MPDRNLCRRQIQLQSTARLGALPMARTIMAREGVPGFYRGFLPNALKNLPNKGALSHARVCMAHLGCRRSAHIVRLAIHGQVAGEQRLQIQWIEAKQRPNSIMHLCQCIIWLKSAVLRMGACSTMISPGLKSCGHAVKVIW